MILSKLNSFNFTIISHHNLRSTFLLFAFNFSFQYYQCISTTTSSFKTHVQHKQVSVVVVVWYDHNAFQFQQVSVVLFPCISASSENTSVRENMCNISKKVKSHVLWIFNKNVKKRNRLVMQPLITQLPEARTGKSRSATSNILLRSVDTRNYATENHVW